MKGIGRPRDTNSTDADVTNLNCSWFYDWWYEASAISGVEYVPMVYGDWEAYSSSTPAQIVTATGTNILLGFNEPDDVNQSNMTVARAVALWPDLEATGCRLGSPAVSAGANGLTWLEDFMAEDVNVDFICLHYYPDLTSGTLLNYITTIWNAYGLPIWLTEVSNLTGSIADNETLIPSVISTIQNLNYVERIAWFSTRGITAYPGSALIDSSGNLNDAGTVYAGYGSEIDYTNSPSESPSESPSLSPSSSESPSESSSASPSLSPSSSESPSLSPSSSESPSESASLSPSSSASPSLSPSSSQSPSESPSESASISPSSSESPSLSPSSSESPSLSPSSSESPSFSPSSSESPSESPSNSPSESPSESASLSPSSSLSPSASLSPSSSASPSIPPATGQKPILSIQLDDELWMTINHKILAYLDANNYYTDVNTFTGVCTAVNVQSSSYTLDELDYVVVFTATATATLPPAYGLGQTYRIVCRAGTLTIDGNGSDTIKGESTQTLYEGEGLIITDTALGLWE